MDTGSSTIDRMDGWCPPSCCPTTTCWRIVQLGAAGYSAQAYSRFMKRQWTTAFRSGFLCDAWALAPGNLRRGVEADIGLPPTLFYGLTTLGTCTDTEFAEFGLDVVWMIRTGNIAWFSPLTGYVCGAFDSRSASRCAATTNDSHKLVDHREQEHGRG